MKYHSLLQLFHEGNSNYKKEYARRFESEDAVHLDIMLNDTPFYFWMHSGIYQTIINIERINKYIVYFCAKLPGLALTQYEQRCLIDEIVLTNKIEGVQSTRKEIEEILSDLSDKAGEKRKPRRFTDLVKKYYALINRENIQIQESADIRKIYDEILYEEIKQSDPKDLPDGEMFRNGNVVVESTTGKQIHHGLMPESNIIETMDKAIRFLNNSEVDLLVRTAVFHYLFGYIHPFYDGNGRLSRFISSHLLSHALNPIIGFRLSYTIRENISEYYKAFKTCNDPLNKGDITPFIEMFLRIVEISMEQLSDSLERRYNQFEKYKKTIHNLPNGQEEKYSRLYYLLLQAALFSNEGISNKELSAYLLVAPGTVQHRLNQMPEGLIIRNKSGRQYKYLLNMQEVDKYTET